MNGQPWRGLPLPILRVLHRIAKDPRKGARPFFRDPKEMIALRNHIRALEGQTNGNREAQA